METKNASGISNPNLLLPQIDKKVKESPEMSNRSGSQTNNDNLPKSINKLKKQKHFDLKELLSQ